MRLTAPTENTQYRLTMMTAVVVVCLLVPKCLLVFKNRDHTGTVPIAIALLHLWIHEVDVRRVLIIILLRPETVSATAAILPGFSGWTTQLAAVMTGRTGGANFTTGHGQCL